LPSLTRHCVPQTRPFLPHSTSRVKFCPLARSETGQSETGSVGDRPEREIGQSGIGGAGSVGDRPERETGQSGIGGAGSVGDAELARSETGQSGRAARAEDRPERGRPYSISIR
jgi:hypothetical protein